MTPIVPPEPTVQYDRYAMISSYGDVIRSERLRLGWSQRTLARHAGITPGYVALLERGARLPGEELWARLQRLLAIDNPGTASEAASSVEAQTAALADAMSATRHMEVALPLPDEADWFERVPFTTVVGPLGSGKTTFVGRWLSEVSQRSGRQIVWVQLSPTATADVVERDILTQTSAEGEPLPSVGTRSIGALVMSLSRHLEGSRRTPTILCFDDWDARTGGAHNLVPELAAKLEKTPIIATTESARSSAGGATVRAMPRPTESDWQTWCDSWRVPESIRTDFLERIHHNLLAASILRSTVFFASGQANQRDLETIWHEVVTELPSQQGVSWPQVIDGCVSRLSDAAVRVLRLAALSPEPVPRNWLGQDASTADASRLIEYRLARSVEWKGSGRVAVHPVLHEYVSAADSLQFPWLAATPAEPSLVELLLNLAMFDEAASAISSLVDEWMSTSEAPSYLVDWVDRLPDEVANRHPMVLFGFVRALALRGRAGDLKRAKDAVEKLLSLSLSDGQRWQAVLQGADVAIRSTDYDRATMFVRAAESLLESSAGSFDPQAVRVLRTRIHWEQSEFEEARLTLGMGSTTGVVENARHASWVARVNASLGDYATAARAVSRGIDLSRGSNAPRAEAYNAALLAEYELARGNLTRARRLAERSAHVAESRRLANLRAQALAVQAETVAAQGERQEADRLLAAAVNSVTERGDDAWTNAYLLVTQSRLARFQPLWTQLWSLGQRLENEAAILRQRAGRHPVVGALLVESAHCWIATGYSHEARRVLQLVGKTPTDWRTSWEARLLDILSLPEKTDDERYDDVAELIEEARAAGAPYLAATCAYLASTYRLIAGDESMAASYGAWVAEVAESRGWPVLASKARALAPERATTPERGRPVTQPDGTTSLVAPRRRQPYSRSDPERPLPDPFEE